MAAAENTSIPCTVGARDAFRGYVLNQQALLGKRLSYSDVLFDLLEGVGWVKGGRKR